MRFLRQATSITATVLLPLFLLLFGFLLSIYIVFGTPASLKEAISKSDAYDTVIQDALNSLPAEEGEGEREGVPLDDPQVQQIIGQAVPAERLEEQATIFLDSVYGWIRGEEPRLQFTLDLSDAKTNLLNGLTTYASERANSLPDCANQAIISDFDNLDVFSIDCVPPGFDRAALAQQARDELETVEFLEDPTITANDLASDNKTPEQQLQGLKNAYDALLVAVYVTGIGSVLLIATAVFLAPKWRVGLRRVGIALISVGVVSALIALAEAFFIKNVASGLAEDRVQATLADIVGLLAADVRNWWFGYGATLALLGIAALVTLQLTKPKDEIESDTPDASYDKPETKKKPTASESTRDTKN